MEIDPTLVKAIIICLVVAFAACSLLMILALCFISKMADKQAEEIFKEIVSRRGPDGQR